MAVSNVLHGTGSNVRVSAETSEKIRRAAEELNYKPNSVARNLRSGKTKTVGVVFQHLQRMGADNPYYPQLLNGIMAALFAADYSLTLCPKLVQGGDIGAMLDGRFDGVLWARPDFTEANVETLRAARTPMVMLHAPPGSAQGVPTFCADNVGAMETAVAHLSSLGHRNHAFLINEIDCVTVEGRARTEALLQAVENRGENGQVFIWDERPRSLETFYQNNRDTTAYVCFSDTLAGHVLSACHNASIRVPRDVSVVGFDSSNFCDFTTPRLTSVYQPVEKIAYEATSCLIGLVEGTLTERAVSRTYECGLDIRESTCPPVSMP